MSASHTLTLDLRSNPRNQYGMDHKLTLRPTVIGGKRETKEDFTVLCDGRNIGRIKHSLNHVLRRDEWRWYINPPIPVPSWCDGTADSYEAAKEAFREAWEEFYAHLSPRMIARWHQADDASKQS